jgi:hypothetical protein
MGLGARPDSPHKNNDEILQVSAREQRQAFLEGLSEKAS